MMLAYETIALPDSVTAQVAVQLTSASTSSPSNTRQRVLGVCMVVPNYKDAAVTLQNSLSSRAAAANYAYEYERKKHIDEKGAIVSFVTQPAHGSLIQKKPGGSYYYAPKAAYLGKDQIEVLVETKSGYSVKVIYYVQVVNDDLGSYWEETYCGKKGLFWKISSNTFGTNDPATLAQWQASGDLMNLIASTSQSFTGFTDLAGTAVGQTNGQGDAASITQDRA